MIGDVLVAELCRALHRLDAARVRVRHVLKVQQKSAAGKKAEDAGLRLLQVSYCVVCFVCAKFKAGKVDFELLSNVVLHTAVQIL
mmetsp:Transcript_107465/g.246021  ORF Transcript_107465/g.246021 Transcript_107465/m.246021 type:complete len:85 (+) Transcript_107465:264-518(+)